MPALQWAQAPQTTAAMQRIVERATPPHKSFVVAHKPFVFVREERSAASKQLGQRKPGGLTSMNPPSGGMGGSLSVAGGLYHPGAAGAKGGKAQPQLMPTGTTPPPPPLANLTGGKS